MSFSFFFPRISVFAAVAWLAAAGPGCLHAETTAAAEGGQTEAESATPAPDVRFMNEAREAREKGQNGLALRFFRHVIRRYSTSPHVPEAHYESALIRLERKQWARAFDHFQAIVDSHPDFPLFEEVIQHQYNIAEALRTGARLRLFWRVPGFRSPERAVSYYEQVVENAPYSELAPTSMMKAAQIQSNRKKLDDAIELYDRFISEYPDHEDTPDAYFGLAEAFSSRVAGPQYDQGASREAISYYEDFILLFPRHERAGEAEEQIAELREILAQSRVVLGDFYLFRRRNFTAARVFYNEAISIAPVSATADEARAKLVELERRAEARR